MEQQEGEMNPLKAIGFWIAVIIGAIILIPTLWYYIGGDQVFYAYIGWAWQAHHIPPYLSGFDQQMPGIYIIHYLIFKLLSPTAFSIRLADYLIQVFNLAMIVLFCYKISSKERAAYAGIIASVLYASFYMSLDPGNTVLKDGFALTPLLIACVIFLSAPAKWGWLKSCSIGIMVGIAFIFKPTFGLAGAVFAILYLVRERRAKTSWLRIISLELLLFIFSLIPFLLCLYAIHDWGAMPRFVEVFIDFNRQNYLKMAGGYLSSVKYFDFVGYELFYRCQILWLGMFLFILLHFHGDFWKDPEPNQSKIVVASLLLVGLLSMFIQAKGLEYHIIPIAGFASIMAGFSFSWLAEVLSGKTGPKFKSAITVLILVFILAMQITSMSFTNIVRTKRTFLKPLEVAYKAFGERWEVVKYIEQRTKPGDKVFSFGFLMDVNFPGQRLAPTSLTNALIIARPRATDDQYAPVQVKWQKELVDDLEKNPPVYFLIDSPCQCAPEAGIDFMKWLNRIPGLKDFLDQHYQLEAVIGPAMIYRLAK
jgi:hypothetical protein